MTVKPHELVVPIAGVSNYEDAKAIAKEAALDFYGKASESRLTYRANIQMTLGHYSGTVTVYYDENKEEES